MNEKFAEILLIRRKYSSSAIGWDSATHHVLEHGSRAELDLKAAKVMDEEQTLNSAAYRVSFFFCPKPVQPYIII